MIALVLALQLADLVTFAYASTRLPVAALEVNPLMVAAFIAAGVVGVATVKIALIGGLLALSARLSPVTRIVAGLTVSNRRIGLSLAALGGAIGTAANLTALVVLT